MLYNVSQLMREPVGSTRRYEIDDTVSLPVEGAPDVHVRGPVTLTRTLAGILAQGDLVTEVPLACDRCLQPALVPLRLTVEEEYIPTIDPVTGTKLSEPPEPSAFRIDAHHHLDLAEAIRQAAVLEIPITALCRPDCRGLCPSCGADLNTNPCTCERGPVDERWAALRTLKDGG